MTAASSSPEIDPAGRKELPPSMVERMTLIMDSFDGRNSRRTLEDIARITHLPRSTAHRILDQLVRLHWLDHTSFGYSLGRRALSLAGRDGGHGEIREAAAPLLHELQTRTGMVVHLAVLDGAEIFYLDKVGGRFAAAVPSRVGGRAPAHSTALGKAMLACLEPEQVESRLGAGMNQLTKQTIGEFSALHQELNRIRRHHGLAFEREECFPGIACVAAPIHGLDGSLACVSAVGDVTAPLERVAPLAADVARRASLMLCPDQQPARHVRRMVAVPGQQSAQETADWHVSAPRGDSS